MYVAKGIRELLALLNDGEERLLSLLDETWLLKKPVVDGVQKQLCLECQIDHTAILRADCEELRFTQGAGLCE